MTSFSFATAPMSPATKVGAVVCSLPWRTSSCPTRSLPFVRGLTRFESAPISPESTRKTLMRPAKGSATVLKTKAAGPFALTSSARDFFAAALGRHVRLHVEEVDDAFELVLAPDRDLDGDAAVRELARELLEDGEELRALAVEHVDEDEAREPQ